MSYLDNRYPSQVFSLEQIKGLVRSITSDDYAIDFLAAISMAESGGRSNIVGVNRDGSLDRGLWQLNNRYHPEVSDREAFTPVLAIEETFRISSGGKNFRPWCVAWGDGACGTKGGAYMAASSPVFRYITTAKLPSQAEIVEKKLSPGENIASFSGKSQAEVEAEKTQATSWMDWLDMARVSKLIGGLLLLALGIVALIKEQTITTTLEPLIKALKSPQGILTGGKA